MCLHTSVTLSNCIQLDQACLEIQEWLHTTPVLPNVDRIYIARYTTVCQADTQWLTALPTQGCMSNTCTVESTAK